MLKRNITLNWDWKNIALQKQLQYKNYLGLTESGTHGDKKYPHILSDQDASDGYNFYCYANKEEWEHLQLWADQDRGKSVNFKGEGLKNLLRSEHIPYNLFYPLEKLRTKQPKKLEQFLERLLNNHIDVNQVTKIKIEFASDLHKSQVLDDHTSFDAYIEYISDNNKCGLGIEVKYTEKSYPYGVTEKKRMFDEDQSLYRELTKRCGICKDNAYLKLREKKLKQAWRNHLLGLRLVELGELDQYHSIHIYPEGNTYQEEVCIAYQECLKEEHKDSFIPITFENFVDIAAGIFNGSEHVEWLEYLRLRY